LIKKIQAENKAVISENQDLALQKGIVDSKAGKYLVRIVSMATMAEQEAVVHRETDRMTQIKQELAAMTLRYEESQKNLSKSYIDNSHLKDRFSDVEEQFQDMTIKNEIAVKELAQRGAAPDPNQVALEGMMLEDARMRSEETLVDLDECTKQLAAERIKANAHERDQVATKRELGEKTRKIQQLLKEQHAKEESLLWTQQQVVDRDEMAGKRSTRYAALH
jgi:hypothetical protein